MLPSEAVIDIDKYIPNYARTLPKAVRHLRDSMLSPFISWSYYVMPTVLKAAKEHPARAVAMLAMSYAVPNAINAGRGLISGNGWASNSDLPDDIIGRRVAIGKNSDSTIDTAKVDRIIPAFDVASVPLNAITSAIHGHQESNGNIGHTAWEGVKGAGDATGNLISNYMGGLPATTLDAIRGRNYYDGRAIVGDKKTQTDSDELLNVGRWIANTYGTQPVEAMKIYDLVKSLIQSPEKRSKYSDIVPRTTTQELLNSLGVNTLTYDPSKTERKLKHDEKVYNKANRNY
jgi:hypothetical protein